MTCFYTFNIVGVGMLRGNVWKKSFPLQKSEEIGINVTLIGINAEEIKLKRNNSAYYKIIA